MEKEKTTLFRPLAKLGKTLPKAAGFLVPMTRCACLIFLSDPGKPGVRSLGPSVRLSVTNYKTFVELN